MSLRYEHLYVSGTNDRGVWVYEKNVLCYAQYDHLYLLSLLYGNAPPVSTKITTGFPPGPNFLRPACPYPGCQLSLTAGHAPWRILLPTTGTFFVFAGSSLRSPAPFGGRFLMSFSFRHSLSGAGLLLVCAVR